MPPVPRHILVTSALPYANGSIHIGHLVEYIQTDIWVRYQRLRGHQTTYVCGDDAHGTPIMLAAQKQNVSPESYIEKYHAEHKADFARFGVAFDNFHTTASDLNRDLSYLIYERVKAAGILEFRDIQQLFDPQANIFLPDRFVKGTCPNCKSPDQYGDSCEVCDKTFDPADLIDPVSVVSGAKPVMKSSRHLFLKLEPSRDMLLKLYEAGFVDDAVKNKLLDWFKEPLRQWDISRDAPFFGFPIPGEEGKFFYNWFDAPIGYLASLGDKLGVSPKETLDFWNNPDLEVYHFIGKDIQYFHALFWPVMLHAAGLREPTKLAIHGHLTVNGKKMSKRDGTFIKASTFAKHLDPQYLRYYYASKLGPNPEDLDLSFEDFKARIDGELVNKLANLFSRGKLIANAPLNNHLGVSAMDALPLLREVRNAEPAIAQAYESRNFAAATRTICTLADLANKYVEDEAPWKLAKTDPEAARGVLTAALEAGRILTIYLKPILPDFAAKVEKFLAIPPLKWNHIQDAVEPHGINPFEHLVARLDVKAVEAMIEESKEAALAPPGNAGPNNPSQATAAAASGAPPAAASIENQKSKIENPPIASTPTSTLLTKHDPAATPPAVEPLAPQINIDQFAAVDLRVGRILTAEPLEKSDKLLKLTLDAGPLGTRTILAGIKKAYVPTSLPGRLVIFCANLAPRAMGKGGSLGTSEGMVCAASPHNGPPHEIFLLAPDTGAAPGQRVH